ncbi:MAG TPA: hypothetical protein VMT82_08490 [candidate division Zixibacteria bacterium]|nr:hypothetical protein [Candidatus Acidoferrales bacterium]HVP64920.1 hypothetical protein [candidate division Zixibacteria bacterium]
MDKQQLAILAVFGVGAWVIWLIFSVVRQYLRTQSQAAAQERLLLRISSPENLQVFLASESGREFLRLLQPDPKEAWYGIIRSAQTAVVFAVLGTGILICHVVYSDVQALLPFSIGALILASAFGASAMVSLALHRRSGLLPSGHE